MKKIYKITYTRTEYYDHIVVAENAEEAREKAAKENGENPVGDAAFWALIMSGIASVGPRKLNRQEELSSPLQCGFHPEYDGKTRPLWPPCIDCVNVWNYVKALRVLEKGCECEDIVIEESEEELISGFKVPNYKAVENLNYHKPECYLNTNAS